MSLPVDNVRALEWCEQGLRVLDQRQLPEKQVYESCTCCDCVYNAIHSMQVRGAPAIGIAAAYGVVLAAADRYKADPMSWKKMIEGDLDKLAASRPTAVNLFWALERMRIIIAELGEGDPLPFLLMEAKKIHEEDIQANHLMGEHGSQLLEQATGLLTHCNTGALATGGYGTALGVIRSAYGKKPRQIYATETRPWMQGTRLTAWELKQDQIPLTLITDSAAAYLMSKGRVQWVIVGADRIAANGDVANKIGTYSLAVQARQHGVKFMVVAPTSTIDWQLENGDSIQIESRESRELLGAYYLDGEEGINVWNPVFDVTPADFIDVIVTEKGVVQSPSQNQLMRLQTVTGKQNIG